MGRCQRSRRRSRSQLGFVISAIGRCRRSRTRRHNAMKGTGKSLTEATGKLKTDATQTKEDAKKLDLGKTKQGVGQAKGDVKDMKEGAKGTLTNPLGK